MRARVGVQPGPKMDDLSPFDERNDAGFSIVRGMEAADYRASGEAIRRRGFEVNAIVNACMRIVADQIAGARLEGYRMSPKNEIEILRQKHPLQRLLDAPNPQTPGFTFRRSLALHLVGYGNAYAVILRDKSGVLAGLKIVHPERVMHISTNDRDEVVAYHWQTSSGKQIITPWSDFVHVKDHLVDPDGYFGFPRGLASLAQMITDTNASDYVRQVLHNSGIPALVMFGRQGVGREELSRAEESWHERMVQQGERGRTRFISGIESLQVIGHSLKDLEFPSLRQISREDICASFGVDPRMVGASSAKGQEGGLSGSQYQEARRRLEQQTCTPLRMAIQEALDISVTPEFGEVYARFSPSAIAAIIETPTEIAQRSAVLVASRIVTLEEARQENGLPEQMDPTHTTEATALQTIKEALEANERAEDAAEQALAAKTAQGAAKGATVSEQVDGPDGITDANNNTERQASAPPPKSRAAVPSRIRMNGSADLTTDEESAAWSAFDARARALEPMLRSMAEEALAEAMVSIERAIDRASDDATVRSESDPWWDRFLGQLGGIFGANGVVRGVWRRMFTRRMSDAMESAADAIAKELGRGVDAQHPNFRAGVRQRVETLAASVSQTMGRRVYEIVQAARSASAKPSEVIGLLRSVDWSGVVTRIAETESVGLINHAEQMAVELSGAARSKRWLSQRDERVRGSHSECDRSGWIDMGSAFPNGLRFAHDPNGSSDEVVNCRCTTMYSDREPAV
jgi:HK97 family phage portal protein